MSTSVLRGLRWSGRITGILLVGLVLVFMVGVGPPNPLELPPSAQVELLGLLLVLTGCVVGWRWDWLGGLFVVCGFAGFLVTELIVNGKPPGGAIPFFLVPGVLYLLSYAMGRLHTPKVGSP